MCGQSDVLCHYPSTPTGASTGRFAARLDESNTTHLSWSAPGGQDRYEIRATRFDNSPDDVAQLDRTWTSIEHFTGGKATVPYLDTPPVTGQSSAFTLSNLVPSFTRSTLLPSP